MQDFSGPSTDPEAESTITPRRGHETCREWAERSFAADVASQQAEIERLLHELEFQEEIAASFKADYEAVVEAARLLIASTHCPACHSDAGKDAAASWFHADDDVDCQHPYHVVRAALAALDKAQ